MCNASLLACGPSVRSRPRAGRTSLDHMSRSRTVIFYIRSPYVPPHAHNHGVSKSYAYICILKFDCQKLSRLSVRTRRHVKPPERTRREEGKKECREKTNKINIIPVVCHAHSSSYANITSYHSLMFIPNETSPSCKSSHTHTHTQSVFI